MQQSQLFITKRGYEVFQDNAGNLRYADGSGYVANDSIFSKILKAYTLKYKSKKFYVLENGYACCSGLFAKIPEGQLSRLMQELEIASKFNIEESSPYQGDILYSQVKYYHKLGANIAPTAMLEVSTFNNNPENAWVSINQNMHFTEVPNVSKEYIPLSQDKVDLARKRIGFTEKIKKINLPKHPVFLGNLDNPIEEIRRLGKTTPIKDGGLITYITPCCL